MAMFNSLDASNEGRGRRGMTYIGGVVAQALLIGGAVFLGVVFPEELPFSDKHYDTIWLPALTPPAKPVFKPLPKVVRAFIPKLKLPEIPEVPTPVVARLVVPKAPYTVSAESIPVPPLPAPPVPAGV